MKFPFALLCGLSILCSPAPSSAEWVTQCGPGGCQRVWRAPRPVQAYRNREVYREYRSVLPGVNRTYRWRARRSFCSIGATYSTSGGSHGYSAPMNGSHGGYGAPPQQPTGVIEEAPSVPTSARPATQTTVKADCPNPLCDCENCQCGADCKCGWPVIPASVIADAAHHRVRLPQQLADFKRERESISVPAFNSTIKLASL